MRSSLIVPALALVILSALGCGGGGGPRVQDAYREYAADEAAAKAKYAGKAVRAKLDTVTRTEKLESGDVLVDGKAGDMVVWAIVPGGAADAGKALALKPGDRATVEGRVDSVTAGGAGLVQLKQAKLVP